MEKIIEVVKDTKSPELVILNIHYLQTCHEICSKVNFIDYLNKRSGKEINKIHKMFPEKKTIRGLINKFFPYFYYYEEKEFYKKVENKLQTQQYEGWYKSQLGLLKAGGIAEKSLSTYFSIFVMILAVIYRGITRGIGNHQRLILALHIHRDNE